MTERTTKTSNAVTNCTSVTRVRGRFGDSTAIYQPYVGPFNVRLSWNVAGHGRYALSMRPTWEYATVPLIDHVTKQILDQWGEDGWELVQVVTGPTGGLVAYMKRPRGES